MFRPTTILTGAGRRLGPPGVAVLVLALGSVFVVGRWQLAAHQDISRFIVAGSGYTARRAGLHIFAGRGYDGQFAYRLALNPTHLQRFADGVALDSPLRLQRITYPALAGALAMGHRPWLPAALVVTNLLALGLLAFLAALVSRDFGRPPLAGLLVVGFFGFFTSLGRDLTEIVTVTLLLGALVGWRRSHQVLAMATASAAVLSRESAALLYVCFMVATVAATARKHSYRNLRPAWLLGLTPAVAFVGWQALCWAEVGAFPLLSSSGKNLVPPFSGLAPAVAGWATDAARGDRAAVISVAQFATIAAVTLMAGLEILAGRVRGPLAAVWAVALLLVISLSANVWIGPADFRTAAELHVLNALVLLESGRRLRAPAGLLLGAAVLTALFRLTSI